MRNKEFGFWKVHSLIGLKLALIATCVMPFVLGCSNEQGKKLDQNAGLEFALIGDMPYDARQEWEFSNVMKAINTEDLGFVIHTGDFAFDGIAWTEMSKGHPPCSDETFKNRLDLAQGSEHPFIFTPGDNDWTDCHRSKPRTYDPLERLAKLRQIFFQDDQSLGRRSIRLTRQSVDARFAKFRENVRWTYGDVLFVTLHMVGSNNNLGRTSEMDSEYAERNTANLVWLQEAFELANRNGNRAIMILAHANPRFETTWTQLQQKRYMLADLGAESPENSENGFDDFLAVLEEEVLAFDKPVVYAHGDSHTFRIDKPLVSTSSRRFIENFTRVETYGYPGTHWVRVIIDPEDPNVFRFRQEIVKENLVQH